MANSNKKKSRGINRRGFIELTGGVSFSLGSGFAVKNISAAPNRGRPNILLIITDQQHIDTVAAGGCGYVKTPAMDRLMNRGVSFNLSYSSNPVCGPARSSIFTGRAASETGVYKNGLSIRKEIPNIGQWFSENSDYETIYAGKWHIPKSFTHSIPGFKVLYAGIGGQGNLCDTSTSRACEGYLLNRKNSGHFFMATSFLQPHDICEWLRLNMNNPKQLRYSELASKLPPLPDNFEYDNNEAEYIKKSRIKSEPVKGNWSKQHWQYYLWSYYRHIEMVDAEIGRILQALEDTGMDKNTLIILTSDHGEGMAHHQMVRKSRPYDEASKVPMILSFPGYIPEGRIDRKNLVSGLDIMPTVCDYAGINLPPEMRGLSLKPVLEGKKISPRPFIVTELPPDMGRMLRTQQFKYITYYRNKIDMLFDMKNDPGETVNLAMKSSYSSVVGEYKKLLRGWESRLDTGEIPNKDAWWRKG